MRTKQVVVVRRDLRLRRAEMAALVAKASMRFFLENDDSARLEVLHVELSKEESAWINDPQVVVLGVASLGALEAVAFKAEKHGLSTHSVTTQRKSDPDDEKSDTVEQLAAIAVGPDASDIIDEITGRLKLL